MSTDTKVTEIFCLADHFCRFFDSLLERDSLNASSVTPKWKYYRAPKDILAKSFLKTSL